MIIQYDADEGENAEKMSRWDGYSQCSARGASGLSGIYNFLTSLNFIQSHMVHVMTREYISLFCDHKERNNF